MHYLRNGGAKEWATFPTVVNEKQLTLQFQSKSDDTPATLRLRQYDVKQNWRIFINDKDIGGLVQDEKDMNTYFSVPNSLLRSGQNNLAIKAADNSPDDIRVGQITLHYRPLQEVLNESKVDVTVIDESTGKPIPSRITIIGEEGILQTVTATSANSLAVRPGYVYSAGGSASVSLPAGRYTLYAGRGFEYSIDSARVELKPGDHVAHTLRIKKEVETSGWVSSDTHVHTFTHSRHGDATIEERAITLAAEGIELPIITDHNQNIDISSAAKATGVSAYFTPITGNELTTRIGHFNIFKTNSHQPAINANAESWNDVGLNIANKENRHVVILNHARDIHNGFRPFDPTHHISSAGLSTLSWTFPANAMEVINSGSQQSDIMTLFNDWFGMMNHGYFLTPVGSSDSHDVSRFTVGQGRTYIKTSDADVSAIDTDDAIRNVINGKVLVSLGLLTTLSLDGKYGPGDLCPFKNNSDVSIEVLGPSWAHAERVSLYVNGVKVKEEKITNHKASGQKWKGIWTIPIPKHDVFVVAIAEGSGAGMPYWPIAEPYQPVASEWTPKLIGSTGAVWIDGDGDGKRSSAFDYAQQIFERAKNDPIEIIKLLSTYHESVATQAAALLWKNGIDLFSQEIQHQLDASKEHVKIGFTKIAEETLLIR
ncbi:MAG TPA: CehA/McbA family metallohydrolase [Chryseolinea sp.]